MRTQLLDCSFAKTLLVSGLKPGFFVARGGATFARGVLLARADELLFLVAVLHVNLRREGGLRIETPHLVVDILAVVNRHLHSAVVVLKCAIAHLEGLLTDGRSASQVRLIALVLQDGFLPQLNSVLFLQLLNHAV